MTEPVHDDDFSDPTTAEADCIRPADVRAAAMDYLARREHTRLELQVKLRRRFADDDLIAEQVSRLADENLQSDARYAESYVRQRVDRGYGPLRIRQELRQKGVAESDIEAALVAEAVDWVARAHAALLKKFGDKPAVDIRDKARRSRYMQYRGFSPDHFMELF